MTATCSRDAVSSVLRFYPYSRSCDNYTLLGGCSSGYLMFLLVSFAQSLWRCPRRKETYQSFQPQQCGDLSWLSLMPHLSLTLNMFVRNSFTQDFRQLLHYQLYKVAFKWSPWPTLPLSLAVRMNSALVEDGKELIGQLVYSISNLCDSTMLCF